MLYHLSSTRFSKETFDQLASSQLETLQARIEELEQRINHLLSKHQPHLALALQSTQDQQAAWDHYWILVHQIVTRLREGNHDLRSVQFDGKSVQIWNSEAPLRNSDLRLHLEFDFKSQAQVILNTQKIQDEQNIAMLSRVR